jgi:hypothetical protein
VPQASMAYFVTCVQENHVELLPCLPNSIPYAPSHVREARVKSLFDVGDGPKLVAGLRKPGSAHPHFRVGQVWTRARLALLTAGGDAEWESAISPPLLVSVQEDATPRWDGELWSGSRALPIELMALVAKWVCSIDPTAAKAFATTCTRWRHTMCVAIACLPGGKLALAQRANRARAARWDRRFQGVQAHPRIRLAVRSPQLAWLAHDPDTTLACKMFRGVTYCNLVRKGSIACSVDFERMTLKYDSDTRRPMEDGEVAGVLHVYTSHECTHALHGAEAILGIAPTPHPTA